MLSLADKKALRVGFPEEEKPMITGGANFNHGVTKRASSTPIREGGGLKKRKDPAKRLQKKYATRETRGEGKPNVLNALCPRKQGKRRRLARTRPDHTQNEKREKLAPLGRGKGLFARHP